MRHLKLALRTLFKTPFVTGIAILSLALGIGANAAIYSLFDQMLLQPLPVPNPYQLINLGAPGPKPGSQSCSQAGDCDVVFSYQMFRDLEQRQTVLTGLAAHRGFGASLSYKGEPSTGNGTMVSGSYFSTLQIQPAIGRLIGPEDDAKIGGGFVTVLSYDYWLTRFGGDPGVLGQTLIINGQSMNIIGVAPKGFTGTTLGGEPKVYVPLTMHGLITPGWTGFENRRSYWAYLFGRMKPGVTLVQAKSALDGLYHPIINDVEVPLQQGMSDTRMAQFKTKSIDVTPGFQGQSSVHKEARTPLILLFAVTGVVLLIACANIANLLLARGAGRATEMGVRLALGASRGQLMVQLLTESVLLALMGGVASLFVAKWTLSGIASLMPADGILSVNFVLQTPVVVFTGVLSVVTGVLFGMFPALHSTRADLITSIRSGAGQLSAHRGAARFRATLVTVQIGLATALLISAGLFMKSLLNVSRVNLGVKIDDVVTFGISPDRSGYDSIRTKLLYERLAETLRQTPGVTGVTASLVGLIAGNNWGTDVNVQGFPVGPDVDNNSRFNQVSAGYFGMLGIPVLAGREFTEADRQGTGRVAIVNETFARKFNLGKDAVGKFMSMSGPDSLNIQIVGLVQDSKYSDVKDTIPPVFFVPWEQYTDAGSISFYVRTSGPSGTILHEIPTIMKRLDPGIPVEDLRTMPDQIRDNIFLDRMISMLSTCFATLATLLAAIGLYGVLAYTVEQRTREIGVRMALGADSAQVQGMVMRQVGVMLAIGGAVGIFGAIFVGMGAKKLLYGLEGHDPVVFALSCLVLVVVAATAGYLPARRASKVDPMHALRYE
ncbi:MAG TPA: ABC transporter permease [Gemmatimonadales bacterium]|nr:ABC transporter permease [Gemmatimonadales bacterium]